MTSEITGAAQVAPTTEGLPSVTAPEFRGGNTVTVITNTGKAYTSGTFLTADAVNSSPAWTDVTDPVAELKAAGKAYADALLEETEAQLAYDEAYADFERHHLDIIRRKETAKRAVKDADARVRNLADTYIQQHGAAPVAWLGTQMRTQVDYDGDALFDAALKYAPFLLVLDTKRVEQFVIHNVKETIDKSTGEKTRTLPEYFRLPVTVSLKPTVTVSASKLMDVERTGE